MDAILESFVEHVKNNRGKYSALGAGAAGIGTVKLGGEGYLGTQVQDTIHDLIYPVTNNLKVSGLESDAKATVDPYIDVYKKTDNILNGTENAKLLAVENVLQKENIPAAGAKVGDSIISSISGLSPTEKFNYMLRNPVDGFSRKMDEMKAPAKGAIDAINPFND